MNYAKGSKNLATGQLSSVVCEGEFVGGCDIVREMATNGELVALLKKEFNNPALASVPQFTDDCLLAGTAAPR